MNRFTINHLYRSNIHDAIIIEHKYDVSEKRFTISATSPVDYANIRVVFDEILYLQFIAGDWQGNQNSVHALILEEDDFDIPEKYRSNLCNYLHFVLQTFSGDEFHIVSCGVIISVD